MAVRVGVQVLGVPEAKALLGRVAAGAAMLAGSPIGVAAGAPYAHWIEEGFYYSGRPGRTRPIRYMARALEDTLPSVPGRFARAIVSGPGAARAEADRVGQDITARAQAYVTVKSGRLRSTIRPHRGGRQGLRTFL
jgi:hypothetical protein